VAALSSASLSFSQPPVCAVPKNDDLAALRNVVRGLLAALKASPELLGARKPHLLNSFRSKHTRTADEASKTPFSPIINKVSRAKAIESRRKLIQSAAASSSNNNSAGDDSTFSLTALSTSSTAPSALDVLELRSRLREEKIARLRQEKMDKEKRECRFRPQLYESKTAVGRKAQAGSGGGGGEPDQASGENKEDLPVYEKLYAYKDKQPCFRTEQELLEEAKNFKVPYMRKPDTDQVHCTFKPVVVPYIEPPPMSLENIAGFREAVVRVQAHRAGIMSEPERRRLDMKANEKRYQDGRAKLSLAAPPAFLSEERIKAKAEKRLHPPPRLFVDVRLSSNPHVNKVVSIPIIDGDNPTVIANNFCRIFALDEDAKAILAEVVRQSMEINGVKISDEVSAEAWGNSPLRLSNKKNVLRRSLGPDDLSSSGSSSPSGSGSSSSSSTCSDDSGSDSGSGSDSDEDEDENESQND